MISKENKIVKQVVLGYSSDFKATYYKSVTENGEVWYNQIECDGVQHNHTQEQPYVARPLVMTPEGDS